ncbi:MAG: hypothetical protein WA843_00635 [Candidatus Saccharimonadales bacterium]
MRSAPEFPAELEELDYPPALFDRLSDTAEALSERYARMARYAVIKHLGFRITPEMHIKIAKDELEGYRYIGATRKAWGNIHGDARGLPAGDIELAADELGVYEYIWPFDEEKMRQAAQEEELLRQTL